MNAERVGRRAVGRGGTQELAPCSELRNLPRPCVRRRRGKLGEAPHGLAIPDVREDEVRAGDGSALAHRGLGTEERRMSRTSQEDGKEWPLGR
jgi:hypothetical protein